MNRIARFFHVLGAALITGAADDDPSGISTYSVAGASAGYSMLWLTLITTPIEESCRFRHGKPFEYPGEHAVRKPESSVVAGCAMVPLSILVGANSHQSARS